jgi:hypothetical protein
MLSLLATEDLIEEGFFHTVSCNMLILYVYFSIICFEITLQSQNTPIVEICTIFRPISYAKPKMTRMSMLT